MIDLSFKANAGHIGCSLSCIDILYAIYKNKSKKDSFILSKGHAAMALYTILNMFNFLSDNDYENYYTNGSYMTAHPAPNIFEEVPFATGSLGHGFSLAAGIALAKKFKFDESLVIALLSDGETNEGTTWEAAHFAVAHNLNNLIIIIDNNKIQGIDRVENVLGNTACPYKFEKIGFNVLKIDGHSLVEIETAVYCNNFLKSEKPLLIIADTIKGKGVSFMEDTVSWHYLPLTLEQYKTALQELSIENNA